MDEKYEIDSLDRKILRHLQLDARKPYLEIARELKVSGGTIHLRIEKLTKLGIIKGSHIVLDYEKLGFDVTVFLGVHLKSAKDLPDVLKKMETFPEIVEVYYTTGNYALLIKIKTKTIKDFHSFLTNKLQAINSVQSTESFVSLSEPIMRELSLED